MVDTVKLFTSAYELRGGNRFQEQVTSDADGEVLSVRKFCNLPHLSVDLTPDRVLYCQTSLPKLLYGSSLFEVKESDLDRSVAAIEKKLTEAGVDIPHNNLSDFTLSRVDFCRNLRVDHAPMDYLVALGDFYMPRRAKQDIEHETVTFRNSDHEMVFYNKVREVRETEKQKSVRDLAATMPEDILRVECREKRRRAIKRFLPAGELRLSSVFNRKLCQERLLREMDLLVRGADRQVELNFRENSELLQSIAVRRRRGVFQEFLAVKGAREFIKEFRGDWSKIKEFLEYHYEKSQVYQLISDLRRYHALTLDGEDRDLIGEIRRKIREAA